MKRKLLVFISSTYLDLKEERQAAVEAVLEAGHIPAGMELFSAGDKSQLETIRRWIDDSDVYLLILGGRYGSIDPESKKSYTELEYLHAANRQMPHFALVLKDSAVEAKVKRDGVSVIERDNPALLKKFKTMVTRKMCSFVEDTKDIRISIYKSLRDISDGSQVLGWVPAKDAPDSSKTTEQLADLVRENTELHKKIASLEDRIRQLTTTASRDADFLRIYKALLSINVAYKEHQVTPLQILLGNKEVFISGVNDAYNAGEDMHFLFYKIAPHLRMYGLVEDHKRPGVKYEIQRVSKLGHEFIAWALERFSKKQKDPSSDGSKVDTKTGRDEEQLSERNTTTKGEDPDTESSIGEQVAQIGKNPAVKDAAGKSESHTNAVPNGSRTRATSKKRSKS